MENNGFDMDKYDEEAQRDAELFHVGKPLFEADVPLRNSPNFQ
jgi:hypothetical protein